MTRPSLRESINAKCTSCIYDDKAAGSWRAQVTLCSGHSCPLWHVRPTTHRIAESVLEYYLVPKAQRPSLRLKNGQEGRISDKTHSGNTQAGGAE